MALSLLPARTAMAVNLTVPFSGVGGIAPYTYAVIAGGAGGTINPSTGLYTSPGVTGTDTIRVTDSTPITPLTATAPIAILNPIELFCDIIQTQLGLDANHIYLWDQKIFEPTDSGLFVVVADINPRPFGSTNKFDPTLGQVQSVNMRSTLSVDIISRGPAARDQKEKVILALNSNYSEMQQNLNSFRVFPLTTSFVNLSQQDGTAILYRFNLSVSLQYFVSQASIIPYYGTFLPTTVVTEA